MGTTLASPGVVVPDGVTGEQVACAYCGATMMDLYLVVHLCMEMADALLHRREQEAVQP